jgi:hypothetical protein
MPRLRAMRFTKSAASSEITIRITATRHSNDPRTRLASIGQKRRIAERAKSQTLLETIIQNRRDHIKDRPQPFPSFRSADKEGKAIEKIVVVEVGRFRIRGNEWISEDRKAARDGREDPRALPVAHRARATQTLQDRGVRLT